MTYYWLSLTKNEFPEHLYTTRIINKTEFATASLSMLDDILFDEFYILGVISKTSNKGGSRCNVTKRMWLTCNHAHIFKDGDTTTKSNYDII